MNDALDLVSSSLSDNPTKAELATFATIKTIADAVKSGNPESYIDTGIKALDALTVTSEVAGIDLFAEIKAKVDEMYASGRVPAMSDDELDELVREADEERYKQFVRIAEKR